ncbi:MAG: zinc metallopeptidase [Bacteroidales bacterium]|nr:zinc metallopeptidase [Bacteroidales bacterium]MBR0083120.1 zinc metallopeptidase [Bacteroidales bacterium]
MPPRRTFCPSPDGQCLFCDRTLGLTVAAHETGHAIQHAKGYGPLRLRTAMVPVVTFANNTVQWVLLLGVLLVQVTPTLLWAAIGSLATLLYYIAMASNRR